MKAHKHTPIWDNEEQLFVSRKDTRRVQQRGGLKFIGYDRNGRLRYRIVKSKMLGGHHVRISPELLHFTMRKPVEPTVADWQ